MTLRKVTKNRGSFPTQEAAIKLLYLALQKVSRKWQMVQGWREALRQFAYPLARAHGTGAGMNGLKRVRRQAEELEFPLSRFPKRGKPGREGSPHAAKAFAPAPTRGPLPPCASPAGFVAEPIASNGAQQNI